ncbi:Nitroreductase [Desulfacinum hydrothermale DSM 13146]|uniref:Nitroreductase n=1 Tax=Desulfacinum hydrothermale DSM 13146 TaxID=1121390 RepID=A0A1W1XAF9_9BACT|nr:nitroreductase family protein [Desulfacinum hydrothermale]SMC20839.1 Nitroreductase [Desulfacinum hydrothermale DSM 13146]
MALIKVDETKCDQDGACVRACPAGILTQQASGLPAVVRGMAQFCIACGHCTAVCPHGALDNVRAPLSTQTPLERFPVLDPETALTFLRSRRSIRCYKPEPVPRELMEKLLQAARYAPSGHNSQGLSFLVVEKPEHMKGVKERVARWMKALVDSGSELAHKFHMPGILRAYEQGQDRILRDAPHLIVVTAAKDHAPARVTTFLALEYVELYATSLGLGTCWAGYVNTCAQMTPDLAAFLGIPDDHVITGTMMVGYPDEIYHRLPERNPLDLRWLE